MKPLRLELRGFTAFRRPAVVDFAGRTLFAITGPTGAGKSSLLDAMTWALYGQVPRVGRATHQLVTHGEKSMSVRFDFSARGHTYRVTRTTAGAIGTRLEQALEGDGASWRLVADRAGEVTKAIQSLVGLDYATFTKTIVLPQGEFGAFLRGEERERRDILSTLLGLGAYEAVGRAARGRAREALQSQDLLSRQLERLAMGTPEALAALEAEHAGLETRRARSESARVHLVALEQVAEAHATALRALEESTRAADAATRACSEAERAHAAAVADTATAHATLALLQEQRADLEYDSAAHQRLRDAAQMLEVRERAAAAHDAARAAESAAALQLDRATQALTGANAEEQRQRELADVAAGALEAATGALQAALEGAHAAARALAASEVESEAAATLAEAAATERSRAAEQIGAFVHQAQTLEREAAAAGATLLDARAALEAARIAETAQTQHAEAAMAAVLEKRARLAAAHTQHAASAIRTELHPGDLCPVCGAAVAQLPLEVASDLAEPAAAVAAAEQLLAQATDAQRTAAAMVARAGAELAAVEQEAERRAAREATLATALLALAVAPAERSAARLQRLAEEARAAAETAQAEAQGHRATLARARDARHKLDMRVAEAATRLGEFDPPQADVAPCSDLDPAREAARELARCVERHVAASAAGVGALEAHRRAHELRTRAGAALDEAQRALEERRAATASALSQLANLPALEPALEAAGDVRRALAEANDLAARAADLDLRAQQAATAVAVTEEREQERAAQARERAAAAEAATAERDERAASAAASAAQFAEEWRTRLDPEAADGAAAPDIGILRARTREVEAEARVIALELGALQERIERAHAEATEAARVRADIEVSAGVGRVAGALERELHADRFIAYVQREALAVLAADASSRLLHLTGGRYRLVGEADEFFVIDHLNGEERRSVRTLSGGETFLASLALALALSERLPELAGAGGALSLESLFLDEGFGSLDAASLDIAIEGLERLAGGRRLIGVISHVPEIAERLPDRIDIVKAPDGSSIAGHAVAP